MGTTKGRPTSVYLPEQLAARVDEAKASQPGLTMTEIIRRGLEASGSHQHSCACGMSWTGDGAGIADPGVLEEIRAQGERLSAENDRLRHQLALVVAMAQPIEAPAAKAQNTENPS
jgi:hypothetical protein